MKRLRKGPEINLSKLRSGDVKLPPAITDLYREIKGQHLLPVVILLIIGLIAIPVLVGKSSDRHGPSARVSQPASGSGGAAKPAAVKVTKWTPGLLDYKKNLRGFHPGDPFTPKVVVKTEGSGTNSSEGEAAPPSEVEVEGGSDGGGEEAPAEPLPSPEPSPRPPSGDGGKEREQEKETGPVTVDVEVTTVHEDGGIDKAPIRRDLPPQTNLPSDAIPALRYVGPSEDGTKAMMAVSPEVTAMIGDSKCFTPGKPCGLLGLEVGAPETIVYGPRGTTYRIELVKLDERAESSGSLNGQSGGESDPSRRGSESPATVGGETPRPRRSNEMIGIGVGRVVER